MEVSFLFPYQTCFKTTSTQQHNTDISILYKLLRRDTTALSRTAKREFPLFLVNFVRMLKLPCLFQ